MLKKGDKIPPFKAWLQDGSPFTNESLKHKKIILYFYPQDNTPTCTDEACNLRDNNARLNEEGYEVYGVSPDSLRRHQNFIKKYKLPFSLVSDPDKSLIFAFGVWGPKKLFGIEYDGVIRTTFIIHESKINEVITDVKSKNHANQILDLAGL